jgi:holo-[acyl-carrier protein] synthase
VIVGIGVDLVDVPRMERVLQGRSVEKFVSRVFCPEEIAVSQRSAHPAEAYAARFAAKEALVKALGTGFSRGITPGQIHVLGGERSKPRIELSGSAREKAFTLSVGSIHVSLTHTASSACAMVILESNASCAPHPA